MWRARGFTFSFALAGHSLRNTGDRQAGLGLACCSPSLWEAFAMDRSAIIGIFTACRAFRAPCRVAEQAFRTVRSLSFPSIRTPYRRRSYLLLYDCFSDYSTSDRLSCPAFLPRLSALRLFSTARLPRLCLRFFRLRPLVKLSPPYPAFGKFSVIFAIVFGRFSLFAKSYARR